MTEEELPFDNWTGTGDNAPETFIEETPPSDRVTPNGEPVEVVFRPENGQPTIDEAAFDASVVVLQTPSVYLTELQISPTDSNSEEGFKKAYPAGEARELGRQMCEGEAQRLTGLLGDDAVAVVGEYMIEAGKMCGTLAIGEHVGMDVLEAYQAGDITTEEFMHEFSREMDKNLD